MKWKTVLRKTCLWYQNLTSQTHSLSCTRHSARLQKHTYPLLHNFSRPFRLGTVLYIHAEISEKHVQHTFCSAPLFHFTFFPQSVKSSLNLFPEQKVQERERERVCVVEASEHSRHKRSVKRPLPLFCILVHPPPSSAPLSCPPLSETQPCSRAEAIWYRPKSTANAVHVCVRERDQELKFTVCTVLHLHPHNEWSYVSIQCVCVSEKEPMEVVAAYLVPLARKDMGGEEKNKTFLKLSSSIHVLS